MSFTADSYGMTAQAQIKPCAYDFSMIRNLTGLLRGSSDITIVTYSIPKIEYLADAFNIRAEGVTIVANSKFASEAYVLKQRHPALHIHLDPEVHADMVMADPNLVWVGSADLGITAYCEGVVGIESRAVYGFYMDELVRHGFLDSDKEVLL